MNQVGQGIHLLFYRPNSPWPLHEGGAVHCFNMMRSLIDAGNRVTLLTDQPADPQLKVELPAAGFHDLASLRPESGPPSPAPELTGLKGRFANYWGVGSSQLQTFASAVEMTAPDVLVGVGPLGPLMIAGSRSVGEPNTRGRSSQPATKSQRTQPTAVWYAADDLALLHLTLARRGDFLANLKRAAMMALYERVFRGSFDAAWVVSESDAKALRIFSGSPGVAIVRNGVDLDFFAPLETALPDISADQNSCVFWGALDFAPNRDAVCWFVRNAWPRIRAEHRDAQFRILGLRPPDEIMRFDGNDGITVKANVPDLRPEIARNQVAIFPFVSGAGIKNKVLESASLGVASVGSDRAFNGLVPRNDVPMIRANQAVEWQAALEHLWSDQKARIDHGRKLREWVTTYHSWPSAAEAALGSIQDAQPDIDNGKH